MSPPLKTAAGGAEQRLVMPARTRLSDPSGFTIVEVLVAAFILLVGLAGVAAMMDRATEATASTKTREQGVALEREIVDVARSTSYDGLAPALIVGAIQATPSLADSNSSAPGWTIERRGTTYSVAVGVCSVDDRSDGFGDHDATSFCYSGSGQASATDCQAAVGPTGDIAGRAGASGAVLGDCGLDRNGDGRVDDLTEAEMGACGIPCHDTTDSMPDDYKRIVVLVTWHRGSGNRFALQTETVNNPGLAGAPAVFDLTADPASSASNPILSAPDVDFTATTSGKAVTVRLYIDGTVQDPPATPAGANRWTFNWALGTFNPTGTADPAQASEVLDGSYAVSAKAFDRYDQAGSARATVVVLNRRQPYRPQNFRGGRNPQRPTGPAVEFEWSPNKERDIQQYRVYRQTATGYTRVCTTTAAFCADTTSVPAGTLHYKAVAVDSFAGASREGDIAEIDVADGVTTPAPPSDVQGVVNADGSVTLTWTASPTPGVAFYRIYRDGKDPDRDRYDTASGTSYVDTSTDRAKHQYYITAVYGDFSESTIVAGPQL